MRFIKTTLLLAALTLAASDAMAANVSLGPLIGISKAEDTDAKVMYGAALRAKFTPALGIDLNINYRQEDFGDQATARSWPFQITGLLYPVPVAYLAVGAGWYNTTIDFDDDLDINNVTEKDFGWHFGGGLEFPLGDVVNLAVDLRYVFLDYDFETVPGTDETKDDFYTITAGFLFNL